MKLLVSAITGLDGDKIIAAAEESMKLHTAFSEGQRAASMGIRINPFLDGTAEHAEWERGRTVTLSVGATFNFEPGDGSLSINEKEAA